MEESPRAGQRQSRGEDLRQTCKCASAKASQVPPLPNLGSGSLFLRLELSRSRVYGPGQH